MSEVKAYVLSSGEVVPATVLDRFVIKQKPKPGTEAVLGVPKYLYRQGIVAPPLDLAKMARLVDENTWHGKSVRMKARDTVGHGWYLEAEFNEEEEGEPEGAKQEYELLWEFFEKANVVEGESLQDLLEKVLIDYDAVGNAYIEIIREDKASGPPVALAHIPGQTMFIHQDKLRFVQKVGRAQRWFKQAGVEADLDKDTGEFYPPGKLPYERRATEVIRFAYHTPQSEFYGMPPVAPALGALVGDAFQRDYNIKFFENNAIPQYAVVIEGADLDEETEQTIKRYFEEVVRGNPHSTLVLSAPPREPGAPEVRIRFEKLAVDVKEASFRLYRVDVRNEILSAHAVPPYRIGLAEVGSLSGTTIKTANEIYKFQEIDPRREMLEQKINLFIVRKGFGIEHWSWRLHELDISDRQADAEFYQILLQNGVITPNEFREAMGWDRSEDPAMDMFYMKGVPISSLQMVQEQVATEVLKKAREEFFGEGETKGQ